MIAILQKLEPRFYQTDEYMLLAGDEVNEQIFILPSYHDTASMKSGKYVIGFNDDKVRYFHLKLGKKTVVGGYENMFGITSAYYYKA